MNSKKKALGRGLSALLSDNDNSEVYNSAIPAIVNISAIPLEKIETNPYQPRTEFEENALMELANSIKEQGIIQPITVRQINQDAYQLISGERRLRAAKIAGLTEIPAYIRTANDNELLELALVENIHREDLNAIEIALSYQRLIDECSLSQEELSEKVGKNRSTITNYLRLLKLPPEIQAGLRDKKITMGHARALLAIDNIETQLNIYHDIIAEDYSVRNVEEIVRNINKPIENTEEVEQPIKQKPAPIELEERFQHLQANLREYLKTDIEIKRNKKGKGSIIIPFHSDEKLNEIVGIINQSLKFINE